MTIIAMGQQLLSNFSSAATDCEFETFIDAVKAIFDSSDPIMTLFSRLMIHIGDIQAMPAILLKDCQGEGGCYYDKGAAVGQFLEYLFAWGI